jgi:predicted nucleic acid-binding protein
MSKVLLDTDILSEILKGKSAVVTARAGKYLAQQGCVTTSATTVAEIVYGFRRVGREDRVAQFEASLTQPRSWRSTTLLRASPAESTQTSNESGVSSACRMLLPRSRCGTVCQS